MFSSLEQQITDRVRQSKELISLIEQLSAHEVSKDADIIKIQKGYVFVSLYSSLEFTLTSSVHRFLELLKLSPQKPLNYRRYILCTLLDSNFKSIRDCSKKALWDKKAELFDKLYQTTNVNIDDSIFPSDGINIDAKQVKDIWKYFHLSGNPIPDISYEFSLREIREHRNAIAHGREKAIIIGGRYSLDDLKAKSEKIEFLCFYIIEAFKHSYNSNNFLEDAGAA